MPELEDLGERPTPQVSRAQNLLYTLPHTTESIAEFLTPALARVDRTAGGTQVLVVTRDAETALTISETILRIAGPAGIEVVPATSASRAARIFKTRPVLAAAGPAPELSALVKNSLLKLDTVRTVVLAWADDILAEGPETIHALEALLGEIGEAGRVIVVRKITAPIENLVERYARRARRVGAAESEAPEVPPDYELPIVRYVTVAASARPSALRRLLDDLDPPSAIVVARDQNAADNANQTLRTLGYREEDKTITVTRGETGGATAHTLIFYQPPVTPAELQRIASARPVEVVALATPGEVPWLRELASGRLTPLNLHGPERRARNREEALREELRAVLAEGVPPREVLSLEPLLREYDATELAAAALHVLEKERAQRRAAEANPAPPARPRPTEGDRPRDRDREGARGRGFDRGDRGERKGFDRGERKGFDRGERKGFDRGEREQRGDRKGFERDRGFDRGDRGRSFDRGRPNRGGGPRRDRDR
jgi:ATP-dependent RNA helicase DeaD